MDCTRNIQAKNYGSAIGRKRGRQQPVQEENSAWLVTRVFGLIPSPGSAWLPTSRTLAGHAMARMNWPADIKLAHKTLISPPDRFSIHSLRLTSVRIIYHFLSLIHTLIAFFPIFFYFRSHYQHYPVARFPTQGLQAPNKIQLCVSPSYICLSAV